MGHYLYEGYGAGVFSLNATNGSLVWVSPATSGVVSSPSITGPSTDRVILVGDIGGNVDAFSLATGASTFTYSTGALIFASPAVSTGQFFISSSNGYLYAFGT